MNDNDSCRSCLPILIGGSDLAGVHLDRDQLEAFSRYCELLQRANREVNLTAVREPAGIIRTLFLDSLALIAVLSQEEWPREDGLDIVDIGSGAGIPGLALAIAMPVWHISMVESVGKKARFIQTVIDTIGQKNAGVHAVRAEDLARRPEQRDAYGLATARAVAPLATLIELCAPFVRRGGMLLFPKGGGIDAEFAAAAPAAKALALDIGAIERAPRDIGLDSDRVIVRYEKLGPTPPPFPRRVGLARSKPIGVWSARG
ncbi:MAG: 16S rRNA (guanine(527)-N(7))-methyltransferase RsmG [Chloroflexota bacterium]